VPSKVCNNLKITYKYLTFLTFFLINSVIDVSEIVSQHIPIIMSTTKYGHKMDYHLSDRSDQWAMMMMLNAKGDATDKTK